MSHRVEGVVKWFNAARGYGFVVDNTEDSEQYFVHFTSIMMDGYKTLEEGQKVEFTLRSTPKGVQAVDVVILPQ